MKASTNQTGLIRPFNMDPGECCAMFAAPIAENIVMSLSIQRTPDVSADHAERAYSNTIEELLRVFTVCAEEALDFKVAADIGLDHSLSVQLVGDWLPLSDKQKSWPVDGLYVQVAFDNPTLLEAFDPQYCTGHAMSVYDHLVCTSGVLNPGQQSAVKVEPNIARDYRLLVGDLYREKVGIWCASLMSFRNMTMIKCRAVLAGLDPEAEYALYRVRGGYCLDHQSRSK
ncbi:MAG: hypothetical protein NT025_04370 [bacterium]|nr:hypothetical protein [bacterium]